MFSSVVVPFFLLHKIIIIMTFNGRFFNGTEPDNKMFTLLSPISYGTRSSPSSGVPVLSSCPIGTGLFLK